MTVTRATARVPLRSVPPADEAPLGSRKTTRGACTPLRRSLGVVRDTQMAASTRPGRPPQGGQRRAVRRCREERRLYRTPHWPCFGQPFVAGSLRGAYNCTTARSQPRSERTEHRTPSGAQEEPNQTTPSPDTHHAPPCLRPAPAKPARPQEGAEKAPPAPLSPRLPPPVDILV